MTNNNRGGIFTEFMIFFVIVINLTMTVIEFTTMFLAKEKVTHLARESASLFFNSCTSKNEIDKIEDCYDDERIESETLQLAEAILGKPFPINNPNTPNIKIVFVSWGDLDPGDITASTKFMVKTIGTLPNSDSILTNSDEELEYLARTGVDVMSAEVFYPYIPVTPLGKLLLPSGIIPKRFYETAIF